MDRLTDEKHWTIETWTDGTLRERCWLHDPFHRTRIELTTDFSWRERIGLLFGRKHTTTVEVVLDAEPYLRDTIMALEIDEACRIVLPPYAERTSSRATPS